jgi:3-oxoacyl-ACP reductase-like protein
MTTMAGGNSYLDRYLSGEHEQVWAELVAVGEQVRKEPLYSDAWAVARETMRRVRLNIEQLIPRLVQVDFVFGYDSLIHETLHQPLRGADWTAYLKALEWSRQQPPIFLPARLDEEYRDQIISIGLDDLVTISKAV